MAKNSLASQKHEEHDKNNIKDRDNILIKS